MCFEQSKRFDSVLYENSAVLCSFHGVPSHQQRVGVYRADTITDEQVRRKYQGKSRQKYNTIEYNTIL